VPDRSSAAKYSSSDQAGLYAEITLQKRVAIALGLIIAVGTVTEAAGQDYPDRVVQTIVPAAPGSSADIVGRVVADGLSTRLGTRFIVVNKPGASGVIGTADVARAKPDGYTLMHGATVAITLSPLLHDQVRYTAKSFTPICQTFKNDQVVIVPLASPLKTAGDIVEAAKRRPGTLNVGTLGLATIPELAMIELESKAGITFNNIPFKGAAEEIQSIRSGQIDFAVVPLTAAAGAGLPMLGIFASARNPALPDVPTFKEQGYDVAPLSYGGLLGPAGMPAEVVNKLVGACSAVMKSEAALRVAKYTLQPADYFADSAGFAHNLDIDIAEKERLVSMLRQSLSRKP
jgi:tripartite-type tricarboxylate transporter receptor subunit TctC